MVKSEAGSFLSHVREKCLEHRCILNSLCLFVCLC